MNIAQIIEEHRSNTAPALLHRDRSISYADLVTAIDTVHAGLDAAGIGAGERVALIAGTTPDFVASFFAILRSGAVAVPLNPLAPAPEMQPELDEISPALAMVGPSAADTVKACAVSCPIVALPGASGPGWTDFEAFVGTGAPELVDRGDDDHALLLFTSGTAGTPKAAILSHGNLQANLDQLDAVSADLARPDDVALGVLPLFHILGLNMLLGVTLRAGASVALVERFDPAQTIEIIEREGVTVVSGPPAMWQAWADLPDVSASSFATVRLAISGAASLGRDVAQRVDDRLGVQLTQGYGLTEASPVLSLSVGTGAPSTSVGRPLPGVAMRLVDSNGNDVPGGDEGEIWAKGTNIFSGYWRNDEATADALTADGWLRTGDIGVVDDDGFLYIVDRRKDLVLVSGFNVFSRRGRRSPAPSRRHC